MTDSATLDVLIPPQRQTAPVEVDERAARRALMAQIARLDADLGALGERTAPRPDERRSAAPRILSLVELEQARDDLVERIALVGREAGERALVHEHNRRLREEMLLDPAAYRWMRVPNAAVGEPGCCDWHVRPRFGLLGMLMRWWRITISSGCP